MMLVNRPALDWDRWRMDYPGSTLAEQQGFYSAVFEAHREQRHFNAQAASRAIQDIEPSTVVELGGWDGELAATMLDIYAIDRWTIAEICSEAANVADARHPNLHAPEMQDWYWDSAHTADLFIASHCIEHMTATQLDQTIDATDTPAVYLDAPLLDGPTDWTGYVGTHILEVGWDGVDDILDDYDLAWRMPHDVGEARLYRS